MTFLSITDAKKRESIVATYLATVKRLHHRDIIARVQDLVWQGDLNRMLELVVESTGKSTAAITKELVPIQEEMKILKASQIQQKKMKDAITTKQQQPTDDDHKSNVFDQYLLKFRAPLVECLINISLFNMLAITGLWWPLKQLKLMKILTLLWAVWNTMVPPECGHWLWWMIHRNRAIHKMIYTCTKI